MVVALSSDATSFLEHACTFARVLLHFGVIAADLTAAAAVAASTRQQTAVEDNFTSCALAVLKLPVQRVESLAQEYSAALIPSESGKFTPPPRCAVMNGDRACVLMGLPSTVADFQRWLLTKQPSLDDDIDLTAEPLMVRARQILTYGPPLSSSYSNTSHIRASTTTCPPDAPLCLYSLASLSSGDLPSCLVGTRAQD